MAVRYLAKVMAPVRFRYPAPELDFPICRGKTNGRHFVPPSEWLVKNRKIKFWSIYTITLEPILSEIPEVVERLRAPPKAGLRLNKIFFSNFRISRAPKNSNKEEENLVSATCHDGQAEAKSKKYC